MISPPQHRFLGSRSTVARDPLPILPERRAQHRFWARRDQGMGDMRDAGDWERPIRRLTWAVAGLVALLALAGLAVGAIGYVAWSLGNAPGGWSSYPPTNQTSYWPSLYPAAADPDARAPVMDAAGTGPGAYLQTSLSVDLGDGSQMLINVHCLAPGGDAAAAAPSGSAVSDPVFAPDGRGRIVFVVDPALCHIVQAGA